MMMTHRRIALILNICLLPFLQTANAQAQTIETDVAVINGLWK